ncbi:MAG: phage minor head protein [Candidatus Nanopelagicales bacterium]
MAINERTITLHNGLKLTLGRNIDAHTDRLARAWIRAWNDLADEWDVALRELALLRNDGKWPTKHQIFRTKRIQQALQATQKSLEQLAKLSGGQLIGDVQGIVDLGAGGVAQIIASQMPPATLAALSVTWNRVDAEALAKIVERTTKQITVRHKPLSKDAVTAMRRHLVRGIALGENPLDAAAQMLKRVQGDFNGGLVRARTIARTEMLDAYRNASRQQRLANTDVLTGWIWWASLDERCCSSCVVKHGTEHPPGERGPDDHPQGRCTAIEKTKSWRELGFDIDEPEMNIQTGKDWFDSQDETVQSKILGQKKLDALNSGDISWDQLAVKQTNKGWRDSWKPATLGDLGLV